MHDPVSFSLELGRDWPALPSDLHSALVLLASVWVVLCTVPPTRAPAGRVRSHLDFESLLWRYFERKDLNYLTNLEHLFEHPEYNIYLESLRKIILKSILILPKTTIKP